MNTASQSMTDRASARRASAAEKLESVAKSAASGIAFEAPELENLLYDASQTPEYFDARVAHYRQKLSHRARRAELREQLVPAIDRVTAAKKRYAAAEAELTTAHRALIEAEGMHNGIARELGNVDRHLESYIPPAVREEAIALQNELTPVARIQAEGPANIQRIEQQYEYFKSNNLLETSTPGAKQIAAAYATRFDSLKAANERAPQIHARIAELHRQIEE